MNRLEQIKDLLSTNPTDAFLLFALAQEYRNAAKLERAAEAFEYLRTQHPDYVGLYYQLAAVYVQLEATDKALETYTKGIEIARQVGDQHALAELQNAKLNFELENDS